MQGQMCRHRPWHTLTLTKGPLLLQPLRACTAKNTLINTLSSDRAPSITHLLPHLLPVLICTTLSLVLMAFLLRWLHIAARNTTKLASVLPLFPARMVQVPTLHMARTLDIKDTLISNIKDTLSNTRNIHSIHGLHIISNIHRL